MKIYTFYNSTAKEIEDAKYDSDFITTINMGGHRELSIADRFYDLGLDDELLKILKTFNEDILDVNTETCQYTVKEDKITFKKNRKLPFTRLSRGERIFVLSWQIKLDNI